MVEFKCVICLGNRGRPVATSCCDSYYCAQCILKWITKVKPSCPCCRASLRPDELLNACGNQPSLSRGIHRMMLRSLLTFNDLRLIQPLGPLRFDDSESSGDDGDAILPRDSVPNLVLPRLNRVNPHRNPSAKGVRRISPVVEANRGIVEPRNSLVNYLPPDDVHGMRLNDLPGYTSDESEDFSEVNHSDLAEGYDADDENLFD